MIYTDFHTHLDWYKDRNELYEQLKRFQGTIVAASVDAKSFKENLEIAEKACGNTGTAETAATSESFSATPSLRIIPTVGIHPKNALEAPEDLSSYDELCAKSPLIGEIGMDSCWYKEASPQKQEQVFRYFLNHCNQTKKYCVIHTKDAEVQIAKILEDYPDAKPIIHWYDGPEDVFQEFIKRGYYQTFGCQTIRSSHIQKLLRQMPRNLILAETDNPDSEPWLGGTDNSVHLIKRIYEDISTVLGISLEATADMLNKNAERILCE